MLCLITLIQAIFVTLEWILVISKIICDKNHYNLVKVIISSSDRLFI